MPSPVKERSLRSRAYEHIHRKILAGELAPGHQVSEASLAKEIGISRTPVREAINQLQSEGLVLQVPRYGTVVRRPERQDIEELYELREGLESFAAGLAARRVTPTDLAALDRFLGEMRRIAAELRRSGKKALEGALLRRFLAADLGFHLALLRAAGNRRILKVLSDSHMLSRIFGTPRLDHDEALLRRAEQFHGRILAAARKGNAEGARRIMAEHIRSSRDESLAHFDRDRTGPSAAGFPEGLAGELQDLESALDGKPPRG